MSLHKRNSSNKVRRVMNKMTNEIYYTSDAYPKRMIEGVEFTGVILASTNTAPAVKWVRSDALVRVRSAAKSLIPEGK